MVRRQHAAGGEQSAAEIRAMIDKLRSAGLVLNVGDDMTLIGGVPLLALDPLELGWAPRAVSNTSQTEQMHVSGALRGMYP